MKELIDYFNERYTNKREYICKDLKPVKLLNADEYDDFRNDAGLISPQEIHYYPLFKVPKIKDNRPISIGYILKTDGEVYEGIMKQSVRNGHKVNGYNDNSVMIIIKGDEIVLRTNGISINENNCSLTLYINSLELPKLEYPKNKMDMYRAYNFIFTVNNYINDDSLCDYIDETILPFPKNIDEIDLYCDSIPFPISVDKNQYFLTQKDNYYTVLDAIKKGKSIYMGVDGILPYWKINKEEKKIILKSSCLGLLAEASENSILMGQIPQ